MKTLKLIALAAFALLFSQCKTTAPTAPTGPAPSLVEVLKILDTTRGKFLDYADSTNGNPWGAILLTTLWLQNQPKVESAYSFDSSHIDIVMKSGLHTMFYFNEIDSNGKSLTRGGKGSKASPILLSTTGKKSKNTITNKKVLFYVPPFSDFYDDGKTFQPVLDFIKNSGLGLDVTVLKENDAVWSKIQTFNDYGLVIIDTHGRPDKFLTGSGISFYREAGPTLTDAELSKLIDATGGPGTYDKCISHLLDFGFGIDVNHKLQFWQEKTKSFIDSKRVDIWATSQYLHTLTPMPNTVIFGNMCYSGYNRPPQKPPRDFDPIRMAFLDKNPISYYCYAYDDGKSEPADTRFCINMEDSLVRQLVVNGDSTGHAYLNQFGNEFTAKQYNFPRFAEFPDLPFKHFGADDYSYDQPCISQFTDDRDGQIYKAVCIGKQNWMAENLRYDAPGSKCYDDKTSNCDIYGKLYDWNTVMGGAASSDKVPSGVQGICPKFWHIPSEAEWTMLTDYLTGIAVSPGAMMKASSGWLGTNANGTNTSGFTGLPGGDWSYVLQTFEGIGTVTSYWASTDYPAASRVKYLTLGTGTGAQINYSYKENGLSCRCLKD